MKRLRSGPDLKLPKLKVPGFLVDLYLDLRDRRLLPLVALGLVAIVAVPFLLGGGEQKPPPPPIRDGGGSASAGGRASFTVVESTPGLRDYRKRLRARSATDPFKQRYTSANLTGTKLGSGGEQSSEGTPTVTTTTKTNITQTTTPSGETTTQTTTGTKNEPGSPAGEESSPPTGHQGEASPHLTYYSFAIDVKITHTTSAPEGGKSQPDSEVRHRVIPPAALPSTKTQVVTYMGISPKTRKPMLLVSDSVSAVFGEAKCLSGSESCQLVEVEIGIPTTFVYGPDDARYKINVFKVEPVATGHS